MSAWNTEDSISSRFLGGAVKGIYMDIFFGIVTCKVTSSNPLLLLFLFVPPLITGLVALKK